MTMLMLLSNSNFPKGQNKAKKSPLNIMSKVFNEHDVAIFQVDIRE